MNNAPPASSAPSPGAPPHPAAAAPTAPPAVFGALILAAGASSRLGQPKQLLPYEGRPLVARAAEAALAAGASPVVVVLGAHAEKIRPALAGLPILIAENPAWSEGMASSINTGLTALEAATPPPPDASTAPSPKNPPQETHCHVLRDTSLALPLPSSPPAAASPPNECHVLRDTFPAPIRAPIAPRAVLIALCDQPHFSATTVVRLLSALTSTPGATIAATRHADGGGVPAIFTRVHFPALHALRGNAGARRIISAHTDATAFVDMPELAFDIDTPADWQRLNSP